MRVLFLPRERVEGDGERKKRRYLSILRNIKEEGIEQETYKPYKEQKNVFRKEILNLCAKIKAVW